MNSSLTGSSIHVILQARILEWVAIPFSRGSFNPGTEPRSPMLQADSEPPGKPKKKKKKDCYVCELLSHGRPFCNSMDLLAHQASLPMEFSRQKYWSGLTFPSPRDIPDPGMEPMSPASPELAGRFFSSFHKLA